MSKKTNKLLSRLGLMYGPPVKDPHGAEEFIAEYARLMGQYSDAELEAAADKIIKTRKFKSWPTIAECIAVLEDHRADAHERNAPERRTETKYPEWSDAAFKVADRLIDCEMGRTAAREGWVLGLHDYCRKHRKLPSVYEVGAMKESARFVDRVAAGVNLADLVGLTEEQKAFRRKKPKKDQLAYDVLDAKLTKMASTFLEKRERLARQVLGAAA